MKKVLVFALVILVSLSFVFAGGNGEEAKTESKLILRYAETNGANDERTLASAHFAELVNEKTNGRIEIQIYAGGQLGTTKEVVQALQLGAIDMCNEPATNLKNLGCKVGYLDILSLPFLFRDVDHAVDVMNGSFGEKVMDDINNSGFGVVALDHFVAGGRNFYATRPITKLSDIKGMKIRVMSSPIYVDTVSAFGASATPLDNSEVYSALQTGVIDGAENPVKGYLNNKFYEVAKYFSWSNYLIQPSTMFISQITWNRLSDSDKEIFKECAKEATEWFQELTASKLEGQIAELEKGGVVFCELEDYDKWVEAVQPLYTKYAAGYEDLVESIRNVQ